jgi:gamma-glutamylcyclotransferase (GGCT)/AIG2-like uncharacterized protein YtfP
MTMYFAYGSNMNRTLMCGHCPRATSIGKAELVGWRFVITTDGYASIAPAPGQVVHGVLWRLTPRDLNSLNAYESIDSGLYRTRTLAVRVDGRRVAAMVYIARSRPPGQPKPGYLDLVLEAARDWQLPQDYVRALARWGSGGCKNARMAERGETA